MMIPSERPWKWWNRTEYWRLYAQTHRQVSFKATHYFAADNKDNRNDQIGSVFHKVLFFLVNFLKKCVSQQTRFRQGHLISHVHVQKEAGADDYSVHEGSQSPYRQPSISQFRSSVRLHITVKKKSQTLMVLNVFNFGHFEPSFTSSHTLTRLL